MIRLLDLLPEIENRIKLNDLTGVKLDHDLNRMVEAFIRDKLGVSGASWSYGFDFDQEGWEFEDCIVVSIKLDPTDPASWRRIGWDVTDADGKMLRSLPVVSWALAVVAGGKAERSQMELEAELWATQRSAANTNVSPERKRQNANFLSLGGPRRRRT